MPTRTATDRRLKGTKNVLKMLHQLITQWLESEEEIRLITEGSAGWLYYLMIPLAYHSHTHASIQVQSLFIKDSQGNLLAIPPTFPILPGSGIHPSMLWCWSIPWLSLPTLWPHCFDHVFLTFLTPHTGHKQVLHSDSSKRRWITWWGIPTFVSEEAWVFTTSLLESSTRHCSSENNPVRLFSWKAHTPPNAIWGDWWQSDFI